MSEETDKELLENEERDSCRNLAEELLREMPDMKDEIEQELSEALAKSSDDDNMEEEDSTAREEVKGIDEEKEQEQEEDDGEIENDVKETKDTETLEQPIEENSTDEVTATVEQTAEEISTDKDPTIVEQTAKENSAHEVSNKNDVAAIDEVMDIQEITETLLSSQEKANEDLEENIVKQKADDGAELSSKDNDNNESVEKMETNEVEMSITESVKHENKDIENKKTTNDSNKKTANDSNNKPVTTPTRKREKEEESADETVNQNAKVAKLELAANERKSIIEIHIANNDKVRDDEEAQAELERVRKLKEQSIIELDQLKCQEDKLVRLENISKQLQKHVEYNRKTTTVDIVEEKNIKKEVVETVGEELEKSKNEAVAKDDDIETKQDDVVKESAADAAPITQNKNDDIEKITNASDDAERNKPADKENEHTENGGADVEMFDEIAGVATDTKNVPREEPTPSVVDTKEILEGASSTVATMKTSSEETPSATVDASCEKQPVLKHVEETNMEIHTESSNSNNTNESNQNTADTKTTTSKADMAIRTSNVSTETPTATTTELTPTKTAAITHTDESSQHSTVGGGDHEIQLLPGELTAAEEERDRELRATRETFLQHLPCFKLQRNKNTNTTSGATDSTDANVTSNRNIPRCRECRRRNSHGGADVYCRFYEFRRLQYNEAGELLVAGFPNPYTDPTPGDLRIWQPDEQSVPTAGWMDIQVARYILLHAGDQFCYLWQQEAEALRLHENPNSVIAWKKIVQGLREICDVCDTTLFNFHWTCDKCGFGVCLDCFKDRKEQRTCYKSRTADKAQRGHDEYHWMLCTATTPTHKNHELRELMLTQIIAGDALNVLGRLLHDIRAMWQVPQICGCVLSKQKLPADTELGVLIQDMIKESQLKQQTSASSLATEETLRKQKRMEELHAKKLEFARARGIDYVPGRVWTKQTLGKDPITTAFDNFKHINFLRKGLAGLRRFLPPRAMTLTYSTMLAPGVPHEWLCDGKFLRLTNAMHPDNRILFQEVWKCGQPVMISEVARSLNLDLWRPEAFCNDFGDKPNDLINCLNGNLVPNQPMRYFWEGFQCIKKRLLDSNGKPMLLKLKDWPPGDDFAEILPTRFADLMNGLPMPEYTLRTGNLNIASCLPKMFVPPDLGPKMYNAYGSALHPDKGTTNLHLDISDAVNIMVYVGVPQDADSKPQLVATQRAIALSGCDYLTRARCQAPGVLPGALWHIFPARDADKIRDLLNRVTIERGFRLEPDHDPIHDQNWYLDDKLRARLFKEYGVEGYPIVQCLGDAVFIPAGAPHQVQNLHNCIKVAEDFVSPENITHCYHLTHEFRHLSHSHTNHEDKLQIKNIIYHSIKDCCHILVRALDQRLDEELAKVTEQNAKTEMSLKEATDLVNKLTGNGCDDTANACAE